MATPFGQASSHDIPTVGRSTCRPQRMLPAGPRAGRRSHRPLSSPPTAHSTASSGHSGVSGKVGSGCRRWSACSTGRRQSLVKSFRLQCCIAGGSRRARRFLKAGLPCQGIPAALGGAQESICEDWSHRPACAAPHVEVRQTVSDGRPPPANSVALFCRKDASQEEG